MVERVVCQYLLMMLDEGRVKQTITFPVENEGIKVRSL